MISLALLVSQAGWAQLPDWLAPSSSRNKSTTTTTTRDRRQPRNNDKSGDAGKSNDSGKADKSGDADKTSTAAATTTEDAAIDQTVPTAEQDSAIRGTMQFEDTQTTTVEYNPDNGYYIIHTKIGDVDIATPYLLNQEEYLSYSEREQMNRYWKQKISEVEHSNERKFDITDMKFNIGPADKVFGPGGVQLKMQGSAELLFGFKHQYIDNPSLTERSRNNNIFDFDEKIQASINGKVGDKLNFNLNYNTEASFSFDQQNLKLAYKGKEDDIIQSIEGGNVTMDLNSSLIRGTQALFGVKVGLQFGKLKVQALVSQQNSQSQSVSSEGGAQMTKYEVSIDSYDENRHFFLSYFFRDNYETAMQTLPYVASGVTINRIEVWITNKRGAYDQARNILALSDLGENDSKHISLGAGGTPQWTSLNMPVPSNKANDEYDAVLSVGDVRDIQQMTSVMQANFSNLVPGEDYEKLESARLLSSSEYTLNGALGYISLKSGLNQDEVLAVAYEYTYGGKVYQVGEFSTDKIGADSTLTGQKAPALILKMLKGSNNAPKHKGRGTWDLMMKNVYSLGATSMTSEKFELYVMYRNDSVGTELQYLPESVIKGKQLLRVMNLDRLDSRNKPSPDGKFDYIEGYTALSGSGRIIFPVLEPFGDYLRQAIGDDAIAAKYTFQELYDSTLVNAQEMTEKNKFKLVGKFKGSSGSEIRLNAMNVPRGSVTVTAGGATLVENVDYTVDYTMGTVTILNQSIIESGTKVDVKLENQSTFSMQRKSLFGLHAEYAFTKDLMIGGTIMHLRERPLTTKVNSGSEPLANTIWGVNGAWKTELQWLTNAIDKIPWITATQPSTFAINAEFAHLIPGHTSDVGKVGTAYIDDFEQTMTEIDIHYPSYWRIASTPRNDEKFPEYNYTNNIEYGKNRAWLSWYTPDPIFGYPQSNTPQHIKDDVDALSDMRTRIVYEQELFPNRETLANEDPKIATLNLSFYPDERGPYNIDANQIGSDGKLTNPKQRWAGIMRRLDNTDFEKANIEYISFWLLDPKLTNPEGYEGDLYINLGDISEDILKDGKKSFEHGLPTNDIDDTEKTIWGRVSRTTSTVVAFSNETGARDKQDVGLDGLSTEDELTFEYNGMRPYADYREALSKKVTTDVWERWLADDFSPANDPAGDNYHYYRGSDYDRDQVSIIDRYKHYNGTEGNSPETDRSTDGYGTASTLQPDIEDINNDNTLNEYEKFFEYHVSLREADMQVGLQYIVEKLTTNVTLRNGKTEAVTWYQFKIPLKSNDTKRVGTIRNFKSIRFARLYLTGSEKEMHLRFGSLDLVRGEWRNYNQGLYRNERTKNYNDNSPTGTALMDVQNVNIEENGNRSPVNYILPPGISRQTDPGQAQLIAQNEQAMVLRVHNLPFGDARALYKNTAYDMRNYKHLQMFVHAEKLEAEDADLKDGDLTCFIRLGTDLKNNYYEYEIPLVLTPAGSYNNSSEADRYKVWPAENMFDFPFTVLTDAKLARNKAKRAGTSDVGNTIPYVMYDETSGKPQNRITILGNPTLESVECIMIGVRNANSHEERCAEVWVNELRMSEFNEQGGVAAMANASLGISDIAQLNVAGRLETAGYGGIESNVLQRNMDNNYQLQVSAALEAGRLFPEQAKLQIPLYVAYTNQTISPEYDPLDTDIKLRDNLEQYETKQERDSVKLMSNTVVESTSFSVTNMKVNIHSKKKDMFYDPANFSISASYNKQNEHTPEMERNQTIEERGQFNYAYSFNPQPWEPFSKMKGVDKVKIIKEFNLYYLPQSWSFNTAMQRNFSQMKMRDFNTDATLNKMDITFSKDFTWSRNFDFKYDLSRNLKFSFQTAMNSTVDEGYYTPEIIRDYGFTNDHYEAWKDTIQRSLAKGGTPYTYQQVFTATWNVPINKIPGLDFITANASYNGTYNWARTATTSQQNNLGNTITGQRSWQVDGTLNFETLYNKSKYWKSMTQRYTGRQRQKAFKPKTYNETVTLTAGEPKSITHRLGSELVEIEATDSLGHKVKVKMSTDGNNKATITSPVSGPITLKMSSKDPNQRTPAQVAGDMFAYVGTLIRRVQVTYRDNTSITVPGFAPQAGFMGQRKMGNLYAPGYDFAFGFFGDDFVEKAKREGWLSGDTMVVQPATQSKTTDLDIKVTLEPLPGLKIQLNGKRYMAQSNSIIYSYEDIQEHLSGSFNITQVAIGTAFARVGTQDDNFANEIYNRFVANRDIMQRRVQAEYDNITYPDAGFLRGTVFGGQRYNRNNGMVSRNSADVLVPSFLAAYTGRDINRMDRNPFLKFWQILPNWSVTYDGLGKLPWMRDNFRSVTLTHAYTCKYAIGSYSSYSTWVGGAGNDKTLGFTRDVQTEVPVPSAAYDISSVSLTESFSPLIGVNLAMKNSFSVKAEYRKQRNLTLNVTSIQLMEGHTNEFVIGGGYTIKNLSFITKTPRSEKKVSNDLKLNVDISYKDIKTLLRKVEEGITQASAGNRVFGVKISADYVLSQKINIQFYYDHQGTTPLISTSYPISTDNVGFNIKLMLTR